MLNNFCRTFPFNVSLFYDKSFISENYVFRVCLCKAHLSLSDDSAAINALFAACRVEIYSSSSFVSVAPAEILLFKTFTKFMSCPKTNWCGLKPLTLIREFFALTPHAKAFSQEQEISSQIFTIISCRNLLWHSQKPFDQRDSPGVVSRLMLTFSNKSANYCETNLLPLSENICLGGPNRK